MSAALQTLPSITLDDLSAAPRWVAWQTEDRTPGKATKVPYSPTTGRKARADDPTTWGTREQAEALAAKLPKPHGMGGVGIELGSMPGEEYCVVGIDLDSCIDESGIVAPWAEALIQFLASYCEVSPSGTGFKVYFLCATADLPALQALMGTKSGKQWKQSGGDHPPAAELYTSARYFAVTGNLRPGSPHELRRLSLSELTRIIKEFGPAVARQKPKGAAPDRAGADDRGGDKSRSAVAFKLAAIHYRAGRTKEETAELLASDPRTEDWWAEKGAINNQREFNRMSAKIADTSRNDPEPAWLAECQRGPSGEPRGNMANTLTALRKDPRFADMFSRDLMANETLINRPVPGPFPQIVEQPRPITDNDVSALLEQLQRAGLEKLGKDTLHLALDLRGSERAFHPVRDYLSALRWDGKQRLKTWLHTYLGAANTPYHEGIGSMFLIAMVARIERPGVKCDYVIILEGPQGAMKSTACRVLGGAWYDDQLPDLRHAGKDVSQYLRNKWLVEIAEMASLDKSEASALKAFVTRSVEQYRPSYGRKEVTEPRQCVFLGSTNRSAYLRDETGGRRFWPVAVGKINIDALIRDRDQLFAEAVALYRDGVEWWPSAAFEREHIADQQAARFEADAWESLVRDYVENRAKTSVLEIAMQALNIENAKLGKPEQRRIVAILTALGWCYKHTKKARIWVRPAAESRAVRCTSCGTESQFAGGANLDSWQCAACHPGGDA